MKRALLLSWVIAGSALAVLLAFMALGFYYLAAPLDGPDLPAEVTTTPQYATEE